MKLTDKSCRNAKPQEKPYKLADGEGLYLYIQLDGARYWRLKYYFLGKEKPLALSVYPIVTLAEAREKREEEAAYVQSLGLKAVAVELYRLITSSHQRGHLWWLFL